MGGLKHLLFRLIPIVTLICFICLGITYTFQQTSQNNITYLEEHYYDKSNNFIEIINPTTEQKESANTYKTYEFDFESYRQNIDQDILQRSVSKIFNLQSYENNLNTFNAIWADGYQFGDGTQTIINAVILAINTIILPINILLVPIRIISGILLTAMSLMGININNGLIITPFLTFLVDQLSIPFIPPTYNPNYEASTNTLYKFKDTMPLKYKSSYTSVVAGELITHYVDFDIGNNSAFFEFTTQGGGRYKRIFTDYIQESGTMHFKVWYEDLNNNQILVYNNAWLYTDSQTITIAVLDTTAEGLVEQLNQFLTNAIQLN